MATREENLKKINDELEKLSDEQLEQVAGGTWAQTMSLYSDIAKVNPKAAAKMSRISRSYQEQGYSPEDSMGYAMNDVLKEYGIRALPSVNDKNSYRLLKNNKEIHAADVVNILSFEM